MVELGCMYEWCSKIPMVTMYQYFIGHYINVMSCPISFVLTSTLYESVLGNLQKVRITSKILNSIEYLMLQTYGFEIYINTYMFPFKGFWFGILATSSSLAKIIGPIGVSYVYETLGTYAIFGGISVILGIALFDAILLYPQVKVKFLKKLWRHF